jgi:drug/metabolite transporter (DMT)-like permease
MPEGRRAGIAAVSVATFLWSFPPLVLKDTAMPALSFASYRLWAGVAIYLVLFAATGRRLRWATLKACALGGVLFAGDIAFGFSAWQLTSVADATIISALSTVFIAIGAARWFGERVERTDVLFIAASFVGVALVAIGSSGVPSFSLLGDLFALVSVFTWTGYWLFSKRARATIPALEYMASVMLVAAICVTVATPLVGQSLAPPQGADWLRIWGVALLPGAVGHSLVAWSHGHVEAWLGSLITKCQPVISTVLAWVWLNETLTPLTALGGAVVIGSTAAIVVRVRGTRSSPDDVPAAS